VTNERERDIVLKELVSIAPELEGEEIDPDLNFRDQFDFDSIDFINFAIGVHKKLEIDIPEVDYPKMSSLSGCIAYIDSRLSTTVKE
jgi:acyl carrier protein